MVDQVRTSLGSHFAQFFDRPVDSKLVPDYYSVIKRPMDLGTLKSKLHDGHYSAPQQFAEVTEFLLSACSCPSVAVTSANGSSDCKC